MLSLLKFLYFLNRLLEFTFRLGATNSQCYGTSKTDLDREIKSVLLLTSCSNGVHWTIIDRFRISDILAPNFGFLFSLIHLNCFYTFIFIELSVEFYLTKNQKIPIVFSNGDK